LDVTTPSSELVRLAHGDAWQELGRLFAGRGGGTAVYPNVRLMASGLPHPQWNSGDVLAADVDLEHVREFYAAHEVPWGLRVPDEIGWSHGQRVLHLRLMGLPASAFRPAEQPPEIELVAAGPADLDAVAAADAAAFGSDPDSTRPWLAALLAAPPATVTVVRAVSDRQTIGTGYSVCADGLASRTVYVAGIAVIPGYRRRGYGGAISSWLVQRGLDAGATLAHLHPDDDRAASLYAKLGFVETRGLDVFVGM
jgi:GNAT superfamily N-acetyltransferase